MKKKLMLMIVTLIFISTSVVTFSHGYKPADTSQVWVDDDFTSGTSGWQTTHFDNIQDAVDAVDFGGVVTINEGIYNEHVVVDRKMDIEGVSRHLVTIDGSGAGSVISAQANNLIIKGLTLTNGNIGLDLQCNNSEILLLNLTNNEKAINSVGDNNEIYWNDLTSNEKAFYIDWSSEDNIIHHNNVWSNTHNTWVNEIGVNKWNQSYDENIADGNGNYWDDHWNFTDENSGVNQNLSGSDGITDTNYDVSREDLDYYPLVGRYDPPSDNPPSVSMTNPSDGENFVDVNLAQIDVSIQDSDWGASLDWTIEGTYLSDSSGTGDTPGVKSASISRTLPYSSNIYIYVNVTDGIFDISETFMFSTESEYGGNSIQETIDNAEEGDTISLPAGTFEENIVIDKKITLDGKSRFDTIIDGDGDCAIKIENTSDVEIKSLKIINCNSGGIEVHNSEDISIVACGFVDNPDGILFNTTKNSEIRGCFFQRNDNGIHFIDSDDNNVMYNNLSGEYSIFVPHRENGNNKGIYFVNSDGNKIFENIIKYNDKDGIHLLTSSHNDIAKNIVGFNGDAGILLDTEFPGSTVRENVVFNNGESGILCFGPDFGIEQYSEAVTINYNDVYKNYNSGIRALGLEYSTIAANKAHSNIQQGIDLWSCNETLVHSNNISGNEKYGIRIYHSFDNEIFENNIYGYSWDYDITSQRYGIYVHDEVAISPSNNLIYHNNLWEHVDKTAIDYTDTDTNIWNETYPSGGNYYSDYDEESEGAVDYKRGIFQDISEGEDGIVDSPYLVGADDTGLDRTYDHYPLTEPYVGVKLASAGFTWEPRFPKPGQPVTFTADQGADTKLWYWDFDNEKGGKGRVANTNFEERGVYLVKLRTITSRGYEDAIIHPIHVVPDGPFIPDPEVAKYPGYTVSEMYKLIRADKLKKSNEQVDVMVIDSGIQHGTYRPSNGEPFDLSSISSKHAIGLNDGTDTNGHGTWVNYAIGYFLNEKVPNAKQTSYKAFGDKGEGSNEMFIQVLDKALEEKPDIVSISAGSLGQTNDLFCKKIEKLRDEGIIVICAAGNFGPADSSVLSPALSDSAICVAGSDPSWYGQAMTEERRMGVLDRSDDFISSWSSRGPVHGVYPKPDITSPGESILGPWVSNGRIIEKAQSGTSMATPLITGGTASVVANNKGLMDTVKTVRFWDKEAVVIAYEESLRENAYQKGDVNGYGAGIADFEKVSDTYSSKLQFLLIISILEIVAIPVGIFLGVIGFYIYRKRKKLSWNWGSTTTH